MGIHHPDVAYSQPTPTTPPLVDRRVHPLRRAEVVTVTSFADTSTAASTASASKSIPIGPIVGGIVAGVVVVLLAGGLWFWCHQKAVKERKERQARLKAKASKSSGALSARPSLNPKESAMSMKSMDKSSSSRSKGSVGMFAVAGAPLPSDPRRTQREDEKLTAAPASRIQLAPVVPVVPLQESSGSTGNSKPGSPSSSSSRRHRHKRSLSKEPVVTGPSTSSIVHKYQPARPSPLAVAAKSADGTAMTHVRGNSNSATSPPLSATGSGSREGSLSGSGILAVKAEERKPDTAIPKWGQKPFRSAVPSTQTASGADTVEHMPDEEESEDDDPFEHSKYDRHRSTASTQTSAAGSTMGKRDTVRQSRDRRDVMGGIAEWQDEVEVGVAYSPSKAPGQNGYTSHTARDQGTAYPYPPRQQGYESQNERHGYQADVQPRNPFVDERYRG
ncbi:hypothetical protein QFC22_001768 [Naganishia vaughanmartiniae]|uniref:Uncharacterized protein n=1 Tax=Naganishia vaughanmartiniae TaxID=1424756 RepID=A0ACC2XEK3_9TREE|nr:hypothetical protein QFC22_001768 [Naganishia vaughanmartiniae]